MCMNARWLLESVLASASGMEVFFLKIFALEWNFVVDILCVFALGVQCSACPPSLGTLEI